MSYTFQKWNPVTHQIIEAELDYNSIVDALNNLLTTLDNINPPSSTIPIPTFSLNVDYEGLGTYDFRCWIKVTIPHTNNASNFVVAYKQSTDTIFNTFIVKQEESGDTVALTPILKENTLYDVKVRCIGGTGGIGDFSAIQQITTPANTIAYPVPENVSAYGILNGVIISWDSLDRTYYRYASYNVYHNTVDDFDTATLVGNISGSDYIWNMDEEDEYVPQYFWVTSVSPSGIESNPSTVVNATPIKLTPLNMEISMMPWTADFKIWEDTTTYGTFYWADNTELLDGDGTIYYADGTTATITKNLTGTALAVGLHYAYLEDGNSNLNITEIYGDAVGVGKNLLGIIHVTDIGVDGKPSTIQPYNSYTPTIGAGGIAAKTIRAEHLITDNIILYGTQIADGIISSDHVLQIDAEKILLSSVGGTFFLNEWQDPNDMTKIDGGTIYTNTITSDSILSLVADKLELIAESGVFFSSLLESGTTYIKGGAIYANSITLDRMGEGVIEDGGTTYIDGGSIYTGSITADQITSNWITGKNIRTASSGQRIILGTYTLDGITATGIGCVGESLLFFDISENFCGGIAGDSGDLLIGNPEGKIIIEAAEGNGIVEIAGTISLQNSIDSMFEFRSPLTPITAEDLIDYIWEWENGIWTPSGKTIPTGNSFLRIKDETTNYATDLFGIIVTHDGDTNPVFGISTGFVVKKDISCGGFVTANQGVFAAGSGLQTQFDPAGVWLTHSGLSSIHDIDQLSSAPANPVEGQYYINTINNLLFQYNGSTWISKGNADDCTYNFDTFVIRKAGYTAPKPPFATANLPIPSSELGHVMANTLYADNLKKVDGTNWDFEIYDQSLNTTNDVRFNSVSCDLALKVGSWGSQEFSVTVDSSKIYLTSHAARDFYFGNLSGSKSIFQRDVELLEDLDVAGNLYLGSSGYKAIFTVGHDSTYLYLYTTQDYVGLGTATYPFKWGDFYDLFAQYSLHLGTGTSEIAFTSGIDTGIRYLTPDGTNKTVGLGSAGHYFKYVDSDIIYANILQGLENTWLTIASGTQLSFGNTDVLMYRPTTGDDANTKSIRIQTPSNAGLIVEQNLSSNHLSVTNNAAVGGTLTLGVGTSASSLISGYTDPYTYIYPTSLNIGLGSNINYFRWINVYDAFIYNYLNLGTGDSATSFGMGYDAPYKYLMPEDTNVGLGSDDYYFRWINVYDAFVNHSINLGSGSAIINFSVGLDAGVRYIILDGADKTVGIGSTGHALAYVDTEKIYVNEFRKLSDGTLWDFGDSFDQDLNTTNDVKFKSVSVGSSTYPKVKVSDNGIQFGSGAVATFDIALTRATSPSLHLLINEDTQIDGALGVTSLNVSSTSGFSGLATITRASASLGHLECKLSGDSYARLKLIDDYIAFGSGSANPTLTLGYSTTGGAHLHLDGAFQVDGATGLAALNVSGLVGLNNLVTVKKASAGVGHIDFKVGTETYPRLRIIDNYFAFGTGAASPTLTLSYQTSPKVRLEVSGNFQVVGDTSLNALSVSGISGFSDTVDIQKFAINTNVGSAGQVIKSTGTGTIEWGDADEFDGGTVNDLIRVTRASTSLGHFVTRISGESYDRLQIIDNYIKFGSGSSSPALTLSYETSGGVHLLVNDDFTVDGALGASSLNVTNNVGISGVLNIAKLTIASSYGSSGQVLTSQGSGNAPVWTTPSSTWNGGEVNTNIIISNTAPALRFTDNSNYYGWLEYYTGATRTWLIGLGITSDTSADYEWYQYSPSSGQKMCLTSDGLLKLPATGVNTGFSLGSYLRVGNSTYLNAPYLAFNCELTTSTGSTNSFTPINEDNSNASMGALWANGGTGELEYRIYKHGTNGSAVNWSSFTQIFFIDDSGQFQLPRTGSSGGLLIGGTVQLHEDGANTLAIPDYVKICPSEGEAKLEIRAPSGQDAIINLMSGGDLKATFAYDYSETKTYLAAYSTENTYSELHLNGSKIVLNNDTDIYAPLNVRGGNGFFMFDSSGTQRLSCGYTSLTTLAAPNNDMYISANGQLRLYGNSDVYIWGGKHIVPEAYEGGQVGNSSHRWGRVYSKYVITTGPESGNPYDYLDDLTIMSMWGEKDTSIEKLPKTYDISKEKPKGKDIFDFLRAVDDDGTIDAEGYFDLGKLMNFNMSTSKFIIKKQDEFNDVMLALYDGIETLDEKMVRLEEENTILKDKLTKMDNLEKRIVALENSKIAG